MSAAAADPSAGNRRTFAAGVLGALLLGAVLLLRPWEKRWEIPTVVVGAASSDPLTRQMAADLALKLASLETAPHNELRLIGGDEEVARNADLVLDVAANQDRAAPGATLILKAGKDRSILWSKDLKQPSGNLADLKQQTAFMAARVLGCAAEALDRNSEQLKPRALKLYLNGCAALADLSGSEIEKIIPMFHEVSRSAPGFEGAWVKLLAADAQMLEWTETEAARRRLEADLAAARKVHPKLPAIDLGQIYLLPVTAHAEKMRLANRAIELDPKNAAAYALRSNLLQFVGQMRRSIVDALVAMQLDPLSPWARGNYAYALAAAGRHEAATQELQNAERLWPGASTVSEARFAVDLRYGDPRQALDYLQRNPANDWMGGQAYLEARADRTPKKIERAVSEAERLYRMRPRSIQHLIQVYGEFDRNQQLLELLLEAPDEAVMSMIDLTFRHPTVDFWRDPRALQVAKRAGVLDYWQSGDHWPDFCFTPNLPYDCKVEAARLGS